MRRRREFSTFSLSFIDSMSCGLGAVVLLFMVINHATEVRATDSNREVADKVSQLESQVLEKRQQAKSIAAALDKSKQQTQAARARAAQLEKAVQAPEQSQQGAQSQQQRIAELRSELKSLDGKVQALRKQKESGSATHSYAGQGQRQYLTGLKIAGKHILILVDDSASMLADTVVGAVVRRNLSAAQRRASSKWKRAVATVDWITTRVPPAAKFQIYTFDLKAQAVLSGTTGKWLSVSGGSRLTAAVDALHKIAPSQGTSLEAAFAAAARLSPKPDNIYLLTDGLPTQGSKHRSGRVRGRQRLKYYRSAVDRLPRGVPVNVILFPMQGDPDAPSVFWQLAQLTDGSFLSPSKDWP